MQADQTTANQSPDPRVVVVTGGSRGIGKAICLAFADPHTRVFFSYVANAEAAQAVETEVKAAGGQAQAICADVCDEAAVKGFFDQILKTAGRIDVLVNNAGIRPTQPFREMDFEAWETVLRINLSSAFHFCSAVLPVMEKNKWGRIVSISSLAAQQGSTGGHSHYAASKAGIVGLSKSLAREYARSGITVNVVAPGWIDTPGWGGALDGKRAEYAGRVPVGRLGLGEDVANAVNFLVSDDASYITGVTLPVNGGLYIS